MSPRVCILGASSLRYMPYLRLYTDLLSDLGVSYEVVYWDRFAEDAERSGFHRYTLVARGAGAALLPSYFGFRRYILRLPKIDGFDWYIVLGMQIGVFLADFLKSKRYILDVRDFTHEANVVYRWLAAKVVSNAQLVAISSAGFRGWLPDTADPVVSHNLPSDSAGDALSPECLAGSKVISYIGSVRYLAPNKEVIRCVAAMTDWELVYHGSGPDVEELSGFVERGQYRNVRFAGPFEPAQKPALYRATDFVLCVYGAEHVSVKTLLPNRLYETCVFGRPIIVSAGSYLAEVVRHYGLGVILDNENMADLQGALEAYFAPEVFRGFLEGCHQFMKHARAEDQNFQAKVASLVAPGERMPGGLGDWDGSR